MKNRVIVLENIRSAYNVGTILRTADALGRDVILSWYSPHPEREEKVTKTSLGAEQAVEILSFRNPVEALTFLQKEGYQLIAAECTSDSIPLDDASSRLSNTNVAVIVWNEKTGVLQETLAACDTIVHIPMNGIKESLNVAEAAAIVMRELRRTISNE